MIKYIPKLSYILYTHEFNKPKNLKYTLTHRENIQVYHNPTGQNKY